MNDTKVRENKRVSLGLDGAEVSMIYCSQKDYNKWMRDTVGIKENCIKERNDGLFVSGLSGKILPRKEYFIWVNNTQQKTRDDKMVTIHHETVHVLQRIREDYVLEGEMLPDEIETGISSNIFRNFTKLI